MGTDGAHTQGDAHGIQMTDADSDAKLEGDLLEEVAAGDVRIGLAGVVYPGAKLGSKGVELAAPTFGQGKIALGFDALEQSRGTGTAEGQTSGGNRFVPGVAGVHQGDALCASSAAFVTLHTNLSAEGEHGASILDSGTPAAPARAPHPRSEHDDGVPPLGPCSERHLSS